MAYLLLLPVAYYGTQHFANKIFSMTSDYVLEHESLRDESKALVVAVSTVLEKYMDMEETHPAYKSKLLVEEGIDSLTYLSKTTKEKWFQKNYRYENEKLKNLQIELERRLRLFLMIVKL
jgi:hypothetical protein